MKPITVLSLLCDSSNAKNFLKEEIEKTIDKK